MDPTVVSRYLATVLAVLSLSGSLTGRRVAQGAVVPDRPALSIPRDEAMEGLAMLVEHALRGSPLGEVTADNLLERLRIALQLGTAPSKLPPREQLVAVDRVGRIVAVVNGTSSSVPVDGELAERLSRADDRFVVTHNHPAGQGLAHDDLGLLTKPGVAGVIAVGNDGSLYAASLGKAYLSSLVDATPMTVAGFVLPGHPTVMTFVARARLEIERLGNKPTGIDAAIFRSHIDHLVGLALGHAGTLQYRAVLGGLRRNSFDRYRDEFSRMTEEAGREVKVAMTRRARRTRGSVATRR
jgi:hypothetical protein